MVYEYLLNILLYCQALIKVTLIEDIALIEVTLIEGPLYLNPPLPPLNIFMGMDSCTCTSRFDIYYIDIVGSNFFFSRDDDDAKWNSCIGVFLTKNLWIHGLVTVQIQMSVKNLMEPTWFDKVLEEMVNYANVRVPKEDKKDALLSFYTPADAPRLKPYENMS